jgi:Sensors of blue-light using FAD
MFHAVCASSATYGFNKPRLLALLEETRRIYTRLGITGMLLYKDGNFLQVLESEEETVMTLVSMLKESPGHRGFQMLMTDTSEHRLFPDWSIAFRDLTDKSLAETGGFSDFLNTPFTEDEFSAHPAPCMMLLLSFKKNM